MAGRTNWIARNTSPERARRVSAPDASSKHRLEAATSAPANVVGHRRQIGKVHAAQSLERRACT
jgi:hypothetical protein